MPYPYPKQHHFNTNLIFFQLFSHLLLTFTGKEIKCRVQSAECRMQSAERMECRVQNAECRVKDALVGAIHESPENERIFVYSKSTGRGGAILRSKFATEQCGVCLHPPENKRIPYARTGDS